MASGTSEIKDVELNATLERKDFSIDAVRMDDLANERDTIF